MVDVINNLNMGGDDRSGILFPYGNQFLGRICDTGLGLYSTFSHGIGIPKQIGRLQPQCEKIKWRRSL